MVSMELSWPGVICNLRNAYYLAGGLSGGLVVSAVVGAALTVYVNDGGGLTCTLVVVRGAAGSKLMWGWSADCLDSECSFTNSAM